MSKYISQYTAVPNAQSGDLFLLSRSNVYKKLDYDDLVDSIVASAGLGADTIAELSDVDLTYLSNGDILQYNSVTLKWEAVTLPTSVTFSGSAGYLSKFSSTTNIENSVIYQESTSLLGFFGVTSSSYSFGLGGNSARSIGLERNTTAATAGQNLTIKAGGAYSTGTNLSGGVLILSSGIATGTGSSGIQFYTATAGGSGTTDRTPTLKATITGAGAFDLEEAGYFTIAGAKWIHYTQGGTSATSACTFVGYDVGTTNTGVGNTAVGREAGQSLLGGTNNSFFGRFAGTETTTGVSNCFFGLYAGSGVTSTSYNSFFGGYAGSNTSGSNNVAIGYNSMPSNTSGGYNVGVGVDSCYSVTTGTQNTCIGYNSLNGTSISGSNNIAIGYNSGVYTRTTSANNTYLGSSTGVITGTGPFNYSTAIGAEAKITASNQCVIGGNADASKITAFYLGTSPLYDATSGGVTQSTITLMPGGTYYNSGANMGGNNLAVCAGLATGAGNAGTGAGNLLLQTTSVGASGSTLGTATTRVTILGGTGYIGAQGITAPTAFLHLAASTTAAASLCIPSGTAPSSPVNGDIWFDGTDLKLRSGGATYTLTKV